MNNRQKQVQNVRRQLQQSADELRRNVGQADDPLKAILETSAEVIGGLVKPFKDFESKNEAAWR
jgi:hypothetical protein